MKTRRVMAGAAVLLAAFAAGGLCVHLASRADEQVILPRRAVLRLALRASELPPGYELLRDAAFLESMGMTQNPDYVGNRSELEAIATRGGLTSFLAVYGRAAQPRLMLNGVFFRNEKQLESFVRFQQKKKRPVIMMCKRQPDGLWLIIAARDREATYSDGEQAQIAAGLHRYQQRIRSECVAEAMWDQAATAPGAGT